MVLVSEYVCGLLRPEERPPVHALLSKNDQALSQALAWEKELLTLVDALPRVQPSTALLERLQRSLGIGPPPAMQAPSQPQLLQRPSREPSTTADCEPVASQQRPSPAPSAARPERKAVATGKTTPAFSTQEVHRSTSAAAPEVQASRPKHPQVATTPSSPPPANTKVAVGAETSQPAEAPASKGEALPQRTDKTTTASETRALIRKLWLWRMLAISAAAAAVIAFVLPGEPPPPPVQVVKVAPTRAAILQAPGTSSTPAWTATLGPEGNLMMRPLVYTEVPAGSQALLWTRSTQIPEPRLLGKIDPNQPVQVPAAQLGALADDQLLEITLETDEDVARGKPNGPILFIGQMTMFGSEGAAVPSGTAATSTPNAGLIAQ